MKNKESTRDKEAFLQDRRAMLDDKALGADFSPENQLAH
jgi:hypothetical protein